MEDKVLLEIKWNDGSPDGNVVLHLVTEDFNFNDGEMSIENIKASLLEYGAEDVEYQNYSFGREYHFSAKIGQYPSYKEHFRHQELTIKVIPVIERYGSLFVLSEVSI